MKYPNVLNDAAIYVDGKTWLGVAEVNLPDIQHKVTEFKVFGVSGGMDAPLIGHIDKIKIAIKFKSVDKEAWKTIYDSSKSPLLDIRAVVQEYNAATGMMEYFDIKVIAKGFFHKLKPLGFKQGSDETSDAEYEAHYLKIDIGGEEILEIDKFNYIYKVAGDDKLAMVRAGLGKA